MPVLWGRGIHESDPLMTLLPRSQARTSVSAHDVRLLQQLIVPSPAWCCQSFAPQSKCNHLPGYLFGLSDISILGPVVGRRLRLDTGSFSAFLVRPIHALHDPTPYYT